MIFGKSYMHVAKMSYTYLYSSWMDKPNGHWDLFLSYGFSIDWDYWQTNVSETVRSETRKLVHTYLTQILLLGIKILSLFAAIPLVLHYSTWHSRQFIHFNSPTPQPATTFWRPYIWPQLCCLHSSFFSTLHTPVLRLHL